MSLHIFFPVPLHKRCEALGNECVGSRTTPITGCVTQGCELTSISLSFLIREIRLIMNPPQKNVTIKKKKIKLM